jgi:hypothetical protein
MMARQMADTFGPVGRYITVGRNPDDRSLRLRVNGRKRPDPYGEIAALSS